MNVRTNFFNMADNQLFIKASFAIDRSEMGAMRPSTCFSYGLFLDLPSSPDLVYLGYGLVC